jgi:Gas vesicle synthesis protein GvpL/GvpF
VSDELARWAAERAPALRARAEAEAVAALRNALVEAALGERPREERRAVKEPPPAPAEPGELLWAYCVLSADAPSPDDVERLEAGGLAVLVKRVPRAEFGEEPLRRNLNDLAWLERVARSHEAVLEQTLARATIVPLRICTLYENEESVRQMLARERDSLRGALELLDGRQEWGAKVLLDSDRLAAEARARTGEPDTEGVGGGGAYMLRRRHEREAREMAETLSRAVAQEAHTRFEVLALDAVTRPSQNRELSGHEGEMVLNAAYLVDAARVDELRELAHELEADHAALGARVELTGPWPPYNFVPAGTAAVG